MKTFTPTIAAAALVTAAVAGQAQAHAHLMSASPAPKGVTTSPQTLRLSFSEALTPQFSGMTLTDAKRRSLPLSPVKSPDRKVLLASPRSRLSPGDYTVTWHAVSADTHRMQGAYTFKVR